MKAEITTPVAPLVSTPEEWLRVQAMDVSVTIPWLQNAGGGFGALILAGIAGWLINGKILTPNLLLVAGLIGLAVFAVAMLIRSFRDEVRFMLGAWGARQDLATQAALREIIAQQQRELEVWQRDGSQRDVFEAQRAAQSILVDHYAKLLDVTRDAWMQRTAGSRAAWEAGMTLILDAGAAKHKDGNKTQWIAPSYAAAWGAVVAKTTPGASYGRWVRQADGELKQVAR